MGIFTPLTEAYRDAKIDTHHNSAMAKLEREAAGKDASIRRYIGDKAGKVAGALKGDAGGAVGGVAGAAGSKASKYIKGAALLAAVTAGAVYLGSQFKGKRVTEESIADEPADYETLSQFNPPEAMDPEMPANEMAAAPAPADGKDDEYWQNYVRNGIEGPERANTPTPRIAEDLKADNVSAAQPSLSA